MCFNGFQFVMCKTIRTNFWFYIYDVFANSESVKKQCEASNVRQANVIEEENPEEQIPFGI